MNNGILMTYSMFQLKTPLKILNDFYFDNPRSEAEINEVARSLEKANYLSGIIPSVNSQISIDEQFDISLENLNYEFDSKFREIDNDLDVKEEITEENIYKVLAKKWVVLRFSDEKINRCQLNVIEEIATNDNTLRKRQYLKYINASRLMNILSFISLENSIDYEHSIILPNSFGLVNINYNEEQLKNLPISLFMMLRQGEEGYNPNDFKECRFDLVYDKLKQCENLLIDKKDDKLVDYVASSLEIYQDMCDVKMRITSLVSIIELLIAHNPDSSRYNIEDSIRKQFANKILTILHLNNEVTNWRELQKLLILIYDLRSAITHGSFDNIDIICDKVFKWQQKNDVDSIRYDGTFNKNEVLLYVNSLLKSYLRVILRHYLSDKVLFEILKQ